MFRNLRYKFYCILLLSVINTEIVFGQQFSEILSKTIILKVKKEQTFFRNKVIDNPKLSQVFNELGVVNVKKMFPHKLPENKLGNVDLSLIYQLNYTEEYTEEEAIYKLKKLKLFDYIEPYIIPQLVYTPSDTILSNQYYLNLINAFNAWDINQGDTNIVIGITDTGWDPSHPDLLPNVKVNYNDPVNGNDDDNDGYVDNYLGWDLAMNDNDALYESTGHGVNVTGIAAAVTDNVTGVAGVGFKTKFLPVKISDAAGILTHAYQGVVYAADHGCFIINCSWGSYTPGQFQRDIINYALINKGCLVIGAVGNDDVENMFYPAAYDGVLSVAATEQNDLKKDNSNHGHYVDISAPGEQIWTTSPNGGYGLNGGTSMASPIVAGGAALIKSQFPAYINQQVAALLKTTADDLNTLNTKYVDKLGKGRLDLFDAITAINPQYVELSNTLATNDKGSTLFVEGDTLSIIGLFTNYLSAINGVNVTISSTSPYLNIFKGSTNLSNLNTLDTISNYNDPFLAEVKSGAALNEEIIIKTIISNGNYINTEYFSLIINQDYINLEENQISTTITSKGKIGFNDINNSVGLGFTYKGESLLFEGGLMIGDAPTRVADAVRGVTNQDQDFASYINVGHQTPPYISALDLEGIMNDFLLPNRFLMDIKHQAYAYSGSPDDKYIIVLYDIHNFSTTTINNLYLGLFADWDLVNPTINKAAFDISNKMGYAYAVDNDSVYTAIKLLSDGNFINYAIDLDGSGGVDINNNGFETSEKYTALSTNRSLAGGIGGADVAHVVSSGGITLLPDERKIVAFALIAGDSLLDIQNSATAAQLKYNNDPLFTEIVNNEQKISLYPNPIQNTLYIKSEDRVKSVVIKNILGEIILITTSKEIDMSAYSNTFYIVEVETERSRLIQKMLLAK